VWTVRERARWLAGEIAELMSEIAAQREERARVYRQIAGRTPDKSRARQSLNRAQELDGLAERARRFAATEYHVARTRHPGSGAHE